MQELTIEEGVTSNGIDTVQSFAVSHHVPAMIFDCKVTHPGVALSIQQASMAVMHPRDLALRHSPASH